MTSSRILSTVFYKMWFLMVTTYASFRFKYSSRVDLPPMHLLIISGFWVQRVMTRMANPNGIYASNVDVYGFEMSLNMRDSIEHWNKGNQ